MTYAGMKNELESKGLFFYSEVNGGILGSDPSDPPSARPSYVCLFQAKLLPLACFYLFIFKQYRPIL